MTDMQQNQNPDIVTQSVRAIGESLAAAFRDGCAQPSGNFSGAYCVTAREPLTGVPASDLFNALTALDKILSEQGLKRHLPQQKFSADDFATDSSIRIHGGKGDIQSLTLCAGTQERVQQAVEALAAFPSQQPC